MRITLALSLCLAFMVTAPGLGISWQEAKPPPYRNKSLPEWIQSLQKRGDECREAIEVLGPKGPYAKVAVSALLDSLKDERDNPFEIVYTLASYGPGIIPTLVRELSRTEVGVRAGAVAAMGLIDPDDIKVAPAMTAALKDPDPHVRIAAAEVIARIGPTAVDAVQPLIACLRDPNEDVRAASAEALYEIGPAAKPAVPALVTLLDDKEGNGSYFAAKALGKQGADAKNVVPGILRALARRKDNGLGEELVRALGQIGPPAKAAVPVLIDLLGDETLRQAAIEALGNIGPDAWAAVPALIALNGDAAQALAKIGPDAAAAVPMLIEILKNQKSKDRIAAATALGQIGPAAKSAMATLDAVARETNDSDAAERVEAALLAATLIDPGDARKRGLDPAHFLIRAGELPNIKMKPRPNLTEAKKRTIKALIEKLADIENAILGQCSASDEQFAPLPDQGEIRWRPTIAHDLDHSPAFRELVEIGPDAIPFLLEELGNNSPTKLIVKNAEGRLVMTWKSPVADLPGNPFNRLERPLISSKNWYDADDKHLRRYQYTARLGDICFVALGQIVGRNYQAFCYYSNSHEQLSSPVHDQNLRDRVRSIWSGSDPAQKLFDSLLRDYATEGTLNGKALLRLYEANEFQVKAALRLFFYFPKESVPLIAGRLKRLDVGMAKDDWERDAANGVFTIEFIKAVSWCKEPGIQAALLDIFQRTNDAEILTTVAPALTGDHKNLVVPRLQAMLKDQPESEEPRKGTSYLLLALNRYLGKAAKPDFEQFARDASAPRCFALCVVFWETKANWGLEILEPMLGDKRYDGKFRVCNYAAWALSAIYPDLKFTPTDDLAEEDRQIKAMVEQIARKRK